MADLNLRNVDPELVRSLKVAAVRDGVSMRELCLGILGQSVQSEPNVSHNDLEKVGERPEVVMDVATEPREAPVEHKARKVSVPKPRPVKTAVIEPVPEIANEDIPSWEELDEGLEKLENRVGDLGLVKASDLKPPKLRKCRMGSGCLLKQGKDFCKYCLQSKAMEVKP